MTPKWVCKSDHHPSSVFVGETAHQAAQRYALRFAALALPPHQNHTEALVTARVQVYRPGEIGYSLHDVSLYVTITEMEKIIT